MSNDRGTDKTRTLVTAVTAMPGSTRSDHACLVTIYGEDLGKRIPLEKKTCSIGRSSKCDIQIDQESASRNHAEIIRRDGSFLLRDLESTNGTYVNDEPITEVTLRGGDQVKIGRTIFKFILGDETEAQYHEEIYRLMTIDGLTEVYNKRYFDDALDREASRAKRYRRDVSLIMFDIDHFKKINDTHGHLAGDAVLRQLGSLLRGRVRRDDVPARTGGEEFSVLLPEVPAEGGWRLAENLREAVEAASFRFEDTTITVTISVGVAQWGPDIENPVDLVRRADEKLYEAKNAGRNCVRF